jgi:hypothetical protein
MSVKDGIGYKNYFPLPVGSVVQYLGTDVPEGFLDCSLNLFNPYVYPELYTKIGYTYSTVGSWTGSGYANGTTIVITGTVTGAVATGQTIYFDNSSYPSALVVSLASAGVYNVTWSSGGTFTALAPTDAVSGSFTPALNTLTEKYRVRAFSASISSPYIPVAAVNNPPIVPQLSGFLFSNNVILQA